MSTIAKSAFIGYSYQFQVATMAVFFLEEGLYSIEQIKPEIDSSNHNFDDIYCYRARPNKDFYIQVKNCNINNITFMENKVFFNSKEIVKKENSINIIVTKNSHNLKQNHKSGGFNFYRDKNKDLIVIHLPPEIITDYIFKKFVPSRVRQIMSLINKKLTDYYNCSISIRDLPKLEFIPSDLLEKTIFIRKLKFEREKIFFIIGKPGVGKSHLVNELNISENQLYRFWVSNQDPNRTNRLLFATFLNQLSYKLFESGRLRTEEEIIIKLGSSKVTFFIDGLDHVENYIPGELSKYFDFFEKVNEEGNGKIIVLTRPLNFKINYPSCELLNWSFEETKEYLNQRGITNYYDIKNIFKISNGYPIITSYIVSEWLKNNGNISFTSPVLSLTEYYSSLISEVKFKNNLRIFTLSSTFFLVDELKMILGTKFEDLFEFIGYFPFLFEIKNERVSLIHDSFNNYIFNQIQRDLTLEKKLYDFIRNSLMNADPRFMARLLSYSLEEEFLSKLLHKFCRIDEYLKLKNSVLDYESIVQFYYSLRKIYAKENIVLLSPVEAYELSMIFIVLMRDNVEQSYGFLYQYYNYLLKNSIDWKKHIFSSGNVYYAFSYFEDNDIELLFKTETNKSYEENNINDLFENQMEYEINFFNNFELDNYDKFKCVVVSSREHGVSNSLPNLLVSAYLFSRDEDGLKSVVQKYMDGNRDMAAYTLSKFLTLNGRENVNPNFLLHDILKAQKIIYQLGLDPTNNDYVNLSLKDFIQKYSVDGSFELNDIVTGYIRLANRQNRKIDVQSITYYLPVYYEHKDYSIVGLSEIFYELIIRNKITLEYAFKTIDIFQKMSDKGIRHLYYELINILGPNYVGEMEKLGILSIYSRYRVWLSALSAEIINVMDEQHIEAWINKILYEKLKEKRRYAESPSLRADDYTNILNSKYSEYFRKELKQFSIDLIDDSRVAAESSLNEISNKKNSVKTSKNDNLKKGIVTLKEKDYYKKINLDYLTFSRCCGGWYEKIPYPDFLNLYDKQILKNNIKKILQNIISKSFVCSEFDDDRIENNSDRTLLSGLPRLFNYVELDINWSDIKNSVIKMIDISLGKI